MATLAQKDIRDAFFDELYAIGSKDRDVIVLTNDMDVFSLRKFKKDYPDQFINIGVAEQNMVNVAAGLAACGKKVFIFGILSFVTYRCYEQIKFNICSMNLPVTIVGVGAGLSFGFDGPTHHSIQDIGVMRMIPEMEILNPSDATSAQACAKLSYQSKSPTYVRIDKGTFPEIYTQDDNFKSGLKVARELADINLISTGYMTQHALVVAEILEKDRIKAGVVDVLRVNPINEEALRGIVDRSKSLVVVEDNAQTTGLGNIISECIVRNNQNIPVKIISMPHQQIFDYGDRDWIHAKYGLSKEKIMCTLKEMNSPI